MEAAGIDDSQSLKIDKSKSTFEFEGYGPGKSHIGTFDSMEGKIKLRNSMGSFEINSGDVVELAKGVNVLSARFVDEFGSVKRSMVTTLTVLR